MPGKITEKYHVVNAYEPSTINNTNATGRYIPMARCKRLLAVLNSSAAAAEKTVKLELFAATNTGAGSAALIAGATATFTANVKANKVLLTLTSAANTDIVTLIVYNPAGTGTTYTLTKAASGANTFANAAALIVILNALPGMIATAASEVVTVACKDGYLITATGTDVAGSVVISTLQSTIYLEVNEGQWSSTLTHVAPKITTTSTAGVHSVTFIM